MMQLLYGIVLLTVMGFVAGVGLGIAAKKFEVKEDPRVAEIAKVLPGANCGLCGYPGCEAYAKAIVYKGEAMGKCVPGKKMGVEAKIREIMAKGGPTS